MTQTTPTTAYSILFNRDNQITLITTNHQKAETAATQVSGLANAWHQDVPAESILDKVPLYTIPNVIDDESWTKLAAFMQAKIARLRERQNEENAAITDALFGPVYLDHPKEAAAFRLEMIGSYRRDNPADLESAVELIESSLAERNNRPVNQDLFTKATWNRELFEHRFDEDLDELHHERDFHGKKFAQQYQDAQLEPKTVSGGLSASEASLLATTAHVRELDYLIQNHPRGAPGIRVA